jgi:hypothetical protein
MDYYKLEPDIRRYISTFGNMLERKVYKDIRDERSRILKSQVSYIYLNHFWVSWQLVCDSEVIMTSLQMVL